MAEPRRVAAQKKEQNRASIGTLGEKPLHASLKQWCARPGDGIEVPADGFVIDLVRGDLLIEVQTRGFSSMKSKVAKLLDLGHRLRIVYPIPVDKFIVKVDAEGEVMSRRRSPRHGAVTDVFSELVSFPQLMVSPGFEVEVLLIREEELRCKSSKRAWRRKGWTVLERRLVEVVESIRLETKEDLVGLLPDGLPKKFTTAEIAHRLSRPRRVAQQMAYCLREAGAIVAVGKSGNAVVYAMA